MSEETELAYTANHIYREGYDQGVKDTVKKLLAELGERSTPILTHSRIADLVYRCDDGWSCQEHKCLASANGIHDDDDNYLDYCRKCADIMVTEYEIDCAIKQIKNLSQCLRAL